VGDVIGVNDYTPMKAYKFTDSTCHTRNNTLWETGKTVIAIGSSEELCSNGWIHFYTDPLVGEFINPVHANLSPYRIFEGESSGKEVHEALKSGPRS